VVNGDDDSLHIQAAKLARFHSWSAHHLRGLPCYLRPIYL